LTHAVINQVQNTAVSVQKHTLCQLAFIFKAVQGIHHLSFDALVKLFLLIREFDARFFVKLLLDFQLMLLPQ
jgi:hypothetical protein